METNPERSPALELFYEVYNNTALRGQIGSNLVQHRERVMHLDVVQYDIYGYWGEHRQLREGEDTRPVLCYAVYSPTNKEVVLHSLPGEAHQFTDNLTKARAPFCRVVGNLAQDSDLYGQIRALFDRAIA